MKANRLFFKPDKAAPQSKRLRIEEVGVPLRDALTMGCHPGFRREADGNRTRPPTPLTARLAGPYHERAWSGPTFRRKAIT